MDQFLLFFMITPVLFACAWYYWEKNQKPSNCQYEKAMAIFIAALVYLSSK